MSCNSYGRRQARQGFLRGHPCLIPTRMHLDSIARQTSPAARPTQRMKRMRHDSFLLKATHTLTMGVDWSVGALTVQACCSLQPAAVGCLCVPEQ